MYQAFCSQTSDPRHPAELPFKNGLKIPFYIGEHILPLKRTRQVALIENLDWRLRTCTSKTPWIQQAIIIPAALNVLIIALSWRVASLLMTITMVNKKTQTEQTRWYPQSSSSREFLGLIEQYLKTYPLLSKWDSDYNNNISLPRNWVRWPVARHAP